MKVVQASVKRLVLIALALAALLTLSSQALGDIFEGTLTAKPKTLKKGKKTTATAEGCFAPTGASNPTVEFLFEPPSRPVSAPHYTVPTGPDGKASKTKRLRAVGTWELVAWCHYTSSFGNDETAFVFPHVLIHVKKRHSRARSLGVGGGR